MGESTARSASGSVKATRQTLQSRADAPGRQTGEVQNRADQPRKPKARKATAPEAPSAVVSADSDFARFPEAGWVNPFTS